MDRVRLYFQDYCKWFPEEWRWEFADEESRKLYMKFRARKGSMYRDVDKMPFFESIERDANQFNFRCARFTDIFGIRWNGTKGNRRYVGDADYEQHMYYYDVDDTGDDELDDDIRVSECVTATTMPDGYARLNHYGVLEFVDVADVVDMNYTYVMESHLFKDSSVILSYKGPLDGTEEFSDYRNVLRVWDIYGIAAGLKEFKPDLYGKFLSQVDEHFQRLQHSDREEEREFAPSEGEGKNFRYLTAKEHFERFFNQKN